MPEEEIYDSTIIRKPDSGEVENTTFGKPEAGAVATPVVARDNYAQNTVDQSVEREITNRIVSDECRFHVENQPATSSSLLLDTVSTVDSTVKVEVVEDVASQEPEDKHSN